MTSTRKPPLVFIHGFLDGAAAWADVVATLGDRASDAFCVDLQGMGTRTVEPCPEHLDQFAEDVVIRTSRLGRPFVLVGHSMGAQIAELVAGRLGEQVRALVLLSPVPLQGTGLPADVMKTFHALGGNPAAQRDLRRQLGPGLDGDKLEALSRLGDGVAAACVGVLADMWNHGHALGVQRSRYAGPVWLVRGEADPFIAAGLFSEAVVPRFDNPTVVSIPKAGHWPHVEQPHALAEILRGLLAKIDGSSTAAAAPKGWTRAFEEKSATSFAEAFAAEIVLEASVLAKPVVGADQVKTVMAAASTIYEALAFTQEATQGPRTYLEWEAQAFGGEKLSGVTILTKNDAGKIVRAAIHHRPLGSALKFSVELGHRLHGKLDASHFYSAAR